MTHRDFQNVSLSCSFLQEVTRPILFRSLTFRPPCESDRRASTYDQESTDFSQRLSFLTSDAIVPWVREVRIIWFRPEHSNSDKSRQAYANLVAKLSCFERVAKLHAEQFTFDSSHLQALAECPFLKHLNLVKCPINHTRHVQPPSAQCAVVDLTFRDGASLDGKWWSSFVSPTSTRTITATNYQPSLQLVDILASGPIMSQLKSLTLCCTSPRSPQFLEALLRCPVLETLRFVGEDYYVSFATQKGALRSDIVPHLKSVRAGTDYFASYFCGRHLTEIEATGEIDGDIAFVNFVSELHDHYPQLTSLSLHASRIHPDALLLPLRKFAQLEHLSVGYQRLTKEDGNEVQSCVSSYADIADHGL